MSGMTEPILRELKDRWFKPPRVFVESGTHKGKTTKLAKRVFPQVHTIELGKHLFDTYSPELREIGVRCWLGNSAVVLPRLARRIDQPVFWFLDAHWFSCQPDISGKVQGLPLWAELATIAERNYPDIVVVDDVHDFGTDQPTSEWLDVSLERIAGYFPRYKEAVVLHDQAVVYR
jgi:hypothetical protein